MLSVNFSDRLAQKIKDKKSILLLGIDPIFQYLPPKFTNSFGGSANLVKVAANSVKKFCKEVINLTEPYIVGVKVQVAFFEQMGKYGFDVFLQIAEYAKEKGLITIADVKRGDIPSTAEAYANFYLGKVSILNEKLELSCYDAITINPYLGLDTVETFLERCVEISRDGVIASKGIFVLLHTTNRGAKDFQELVFKDDGGNGYKLYEIIARKMSPLAERFIGCFGFSPLGVVVGATYPEAISRIREILPRSFFLIPGIGFQGGKVEVVKNALRSDGLGCLVTASRSILYPWVSCQPDGVKVGSSRSWRQRIIEAAEDLKRKVDLI